MANGTIPATIIHFGNFEVDLRAGHLRKRGLKIRLPEQSFQVLTVLLEHAGEPVTREELRRRLWPEHVFVDFDANLNTAIARLRQALNDSVEHPRFIQRLPKRGYRFIGRVFTRSAAVAQAPSQRARLVVLPFVNLSGDPEEEYFSDAMTDEIITVLASVEPEQLAVIARTTAMHYKGSHKDVSRIGRELAVDYLVEGSVQRTEDAVAANVQLIQVSDQTHLFGRRYQSPLRDLFNMQNSIAQTIAAHIPSIANRVRAGAIGVACGPKKHTGNLAAYNEYIKGRCDLFKATPEAWANAKQHLERAIALDPEFALGHAALGEFYWYLGYIGLVPPREAHSAGMVHAQRAIELDATRAETHALLAQFHKSVDYNWPEVHREMTLALELNPNSPVVRMHHAVGWLMPQGCLEESVKELERALEFDPLSFEVRFWLGIMLGLSGCHERAIDECRKITDLDPAYLPAYFVMAVGYRYRKMFEEALAAQRRAVELSGGSAMMLGWLGLALAESGETAQARDVLRRLHGMAAHGYVPPSTFAWIHLGLKEIDTAFEWLNRAVEECDQLMMPIKTYGFFAPIRADPRYLALLRRMNLQV